MSSEPTLSPLQIKEHRFTNLRVKAAEYGNVAAPTSLKPDIWFEPVANTPNQWKLVLTLLLTSADAARPYAYEVEIQIQGLVEAKDTLSPEKKEQIALVNGFSVLYSAAREMLINVTARSVYGPISLPTISFVDVVKKATQKPEKEVPKVPSPPPPKAAAAA